MRAARGSNGRRALRVLAGSPDGAPEAVLLPHSFQLDLLVDFVRAGLESAQCAQVKSS
jgi:hypothetical protein